MSLNSERGNQGFSEVGNLIDTSPSFERAKSPPPPLAITLARAFFKSQSAHAHCRVLQLIYDVVLEDTEQQWRFRHLHSPSLDPSEWVGAYLITLDDHRGQSNGMLAIFSPIEV